MSGTKQRRLIVVSNRLPITIYKENGKLAIAQGAGGLVTALAPVLRDRAGLWIGWPGSSEKGIGKLLKDFSKEAGYLLRPVAMEEQEIKGFYHGFSNEILWPLFHEFQLPCNFLPSYWEDYKSANAKFAEVAAAATQSEDFIWVHDYHLMLQASFLKKMGAERKVGFFLHIPFPPADIFMKLPWRKQLVDALLDYDLIGFQTTRDSRNFFEVVKRVYPKALKYGRGAVATLVGEKRHLRFGTFPISIDYKSFVEIVNRPETRTKANEIRSAFDNNFLLFGADRLDYTKGIPQRLDAVGEALRCYPELLGKINMVQVLVPSREEVPQYQAMKDEIERMVGELNGRFARPGWTPIHYMYRNLPREELVCYYLAADMGLITPLRDGMNLVAKEFAACNPGGNGILCLSEFAGAAMEFHNYAIMVNPFDLQGVAAAIKQGVDMSMRERRQRMRRKRDILRRYDIFKWVDDFLMAAFSKHLHDFPQRGDEAWQDWEAVQGPPWNVED